MASQPLDVIAKSPMRLQQYLLVALCCLINVTEGFDMLSLAYAAPVLSKEWATPPALLGLVFSAASIGLAFGSFVLAPIADKLGRRPMMLAAIVAICVSHALSAITHSIYVLMALRVLMGLGLGILVVSLNVLVSEYSSEQRRNILLAFLHAGFTIGMMLGGLIAALVLKPFGWRAVFVAGTIMNVGLLMMTLAFLKESPSFLLTRQPEQALAKLNRILTSLKHAPLEALPPRPAATKRGEGLVATFFSPSERGRNLLVWTAAFSYALVGYFLLNWKPQVLVSAGLTPTQASWAGMFASGFSVFGHLSMGWLTKPGTERRMTAIFFALLGVSLVVFGNLRTGPYPLIAMAAILNFCTVGAYTGIFLVAIAMYRPEVRTMGVGFVVGVGRLGAIIGPLIGGFLLNAGLDRSATFAVFATISVVPIVTMLLLSRASPGYEPAPAAAPAA